MKRRLAGEGSIYWQTGQERWAASATINGERTYFFGPKRNKSREAKMGVADRLHAHLARAPQAVSRFTIGAYTDTYTKSENLRVKTRSWYAGLYKNHIKDSAFAQKRLQDIAPRDVRKFFDSLTVGPATRRGVHALIRRVFEVAVQNEELVVNPAANIRKPRLPKADTTAWTPEEVVAFLKAIKGDRLFALYLLSLTSTMGPAELFGLQHDCVFLKGSYIVVKRNLVEVDGKHYLEETKNATRTRRIELDEYTVAALRELRERQIADGYKASPYVFTTDTGAPIMRTTFRRSVWLPLLETAKIRPIRFYDLRHTASARAILTTVDS